MGVVKGRVRQKNGLLKGRGEDNWAKSGVFLNDGPIKLGMTKVEANESKVGCIH